MKAQNFKIISGNFFILILFILDRMLKKIFSAFSGEFSIWGDYFKLRLAFNAGIAFGVKINFFLLFFLYAVILLVLFWCLIKYYWRFNAGLPVAMAIFFLTLIIAGAFSNLLDRIHFGQVIDYFDLKYFTVFNLADIMIVCGAAGLFLLNIRHKK